MKGPPQKEGFRDLPGVALPLDRRPYPYRISTDGGDELIDEGSEIFEAPVSHLSLPE